MIRNLLEAQEAAAALADFLDKFNQTLGDFSGKKNGQAQLPTATVPRVSPLRIAPEAMADRVLEILTDVGQTGLTPKEIVAKYEALRWPPPKSGKLYTALYSSIDYMRKKGILAKNEGKYSITTRGQEVLAGAAS